MGITSKSQPFLDYDAFAEVLRMIDERDDVIATIWQGLLAQFEFEFIIEQTFHRNSSYRKMVLRVGTLELYDPSIILTGTR